MPPGGGILRLRAHTGESTVSGIIRRACAAAVVAATVLGLQIGYSAAAHASGNSTAQSQIVSAAASTATPDISDGIVYAITQVGTRMIVGGSFTTVANHGSTATVTRNYILAFDATTGLIDTGFVPALDGVVESITPGPSADTVYVGGLFSTVNGVKSKGIVLLSTVTGQIVNGWKPAAMDGGVYTVRLAGGRLYIAGTFVTLNKIQHQGIGTLNPLTGALDPFMNVQLTGHHNYTGAAGESNGAVGPRAMDVSPDGTRLVAVGNFKYVNGVLQDQIVMIDLNAGASAVVDPNWYTSDYTARCYYWAYDSYLRDIAFSPDGSYFVVVGTGGSGNNTDGSRSLCDAAARWETNGTGTNVQPTWVDYTGNDTVLSVAVTGTAIYVGGHMRWFNNPNALDSAGSGSVPRAGMAALDPVNGLPLNWNPGRNPRGSGAWAVYASASGIYVGSDTDYFGYDDQYHRMKIGYFPLAGGYAPASTATATLPANIYLAGPNAASTTLVYRPDSGTTIGTTTTVGSSINWSTTRGAFMVGSTIFYGATDGNFYQASFDGTTVGTPVAIDPYNDPNWANVDTGSGQTFRGVRSGYYNQIGSLTSAFYSAGRLYYTLSGQSSLFWRYFTPDSGIIGGTQFTASTSTTFRTFSGAFLSGSTLYYANSFDGTLHSVGFAAGTLTGGDTVVSGPLVDGKDWRAKSMFAYGAATFPNVLPTASATSTCTDLNCSFDGSASADSDGTIASYAWTFGDGTTGTGVAPAHGYATAGTYAVSLVVTDNRGGQSTAWTGSVTVTAPNAPAISSVASAHSYAASGTSPSLTVPAGVQAGDTELLYVSTNNVGITGTPAGLTGWTQIAQQASSTVLQTTVFERSASATDSGTAVTVPLSASAGTALQLVVYRSVGSATPVVASAQDSATATHVAPAVTVSAGGSWVVNSWTDKSSTTSAWTLPAAVTGRDTVIGTGGGRVTSAVADSGAAVASGTYPAQTATVTGGASGKGETISIVLKPAAPNILPTASATTSCTDATCTFDGSASSDTDGTVQSYAWDFGDTTSGTGKTTSHTYTASGTYNVALTVTDDQGGVSTAWTGTVSVTVPAVAPVSYVSSSKSYAAASSVPSLIAPAGIQAGDTELLSVTTNSAATVSAPSGWTQVASQASTTALQTTVFQRAAGATDSGTLVSVSLSASSGVALELSVYRGVAAVTAVAGAADSGTATHSAPAVAVSTNGSWVLNYWTDKSSTTTAWTTPATVTSRDSVIGTGGGRVTVAVADSGAPQSAGTYPAQTATVTGGASGKGASLSIVLAPQS